MKFKFVKEVEGEVAVYGGQTAKTGDTVEFDGFFAEKAKANPDFESLAPKAKAKGKAKAKAKAKAGNDD